MKQLCIICLVLVSALSFAQDKNKEKELQFQKANNFVYEGNELVGSDDYISAEMEYRKAISEQPNTIAGTYNLGNSYYEKGQYDEALFRHTQAAKNATSKAERHKAYHNIGNILMKNKKCKEAVVAFKDALRNDPTDDETRYNFALAKECAEQQQNEQDENDKQDQEQEKEGDDEEKDKGENEENKDDQDKKDEGDDDKKEGDDQKDDQGKPKDEKDGKEGENKDQQGKPQPKQGQLSPQQIKNLLEAMNNQEQKVQQKINAEKQKGVKVKTEKDW
ncbi:tetratricopeptide repeat protein [Psychroserpens ponticola]|uniref:Tetratricopeptide repeat protein n=1 Tax=Psychroserpens ponticola TaxID=2932268 RepID=A0ABY7RXZ0_9FLAO|nr:tetratricopeptide repeat protein [Psychroserpens ponticola]WCO01878.1 tetratricopeptide repeat protein [Psychroserpens ponticola]